MATRRTRWNKFGRIATGLVVVCFFMPFFGVSCDGLDVVTISGADMVGGCKPGGLVAQAAHQAESMSGSSNGMELKGKIDKVKIEPIAVVALVLALAGFAAAWSMSRQALRGSFVLAIATIAALAMLYVKVGREVKDAVAKERLSSTGSGMTMEMNIDAGSRWGLWLACLSLLGVAAMTGQALREKDAAPEPPA